MAEQKILDTTDYVDRYINSYIIYHYQHFRDYGDLSRAINFFNEKYLKLRETMVEDALVGQVNAIIRNMKGLGKIAATGLNILDGLQQGTLLEETLKLIADEVDKGVLLYLDQVGFDNYESVMKAVKKGFNKSLSKGTMSVALVNEFFRLLMEAVLLAGNYDISLLDQLSDIGKSLSGNKSFAIDSSYYSNTAIKLTQDEIYMGKKIVEYLSNAVGILTREGSVSAESFSSTINNIFSTLIGERISKGLIAKAIKMVEESTGEAFEREVASSGGKLTWRNRSRYELGGLKRDENNRVVKVDIFNLRAFNLSVTEQEQSYDIEIGANTSVKWYKNMGDRSSISIVQGTPLGSYFRIDSPERYYAYNVIAHLFSGEAGSDFHLAFRALRAATSATFLNEWLTGTGTGIKTAGGNISKTYSNKVLLLMVNGRVYSVMEIIRNICDDLMLKDFSTESKDMPVSFSIPGTGKNSKINTWRGTAPNPIQALIRSRIANEILDKLTISAHINGRILMQYARPT